MYHQRAHAIVFKSAFWRTFRWNTHDVTSESWRWRRRGPRYSAAQKMLLAAQQQAPKPNSTFNGVQIGTITYSYRSMPDQSAEATLRYIGDSGIDQIEFMFAEKKKIYAAYHTHLQGSMTAFDQTFAVSKGNMANVDLGHFVAAGGDPVEFLTKFHDRIASFHLKDRTTPANGQKNLPWGTGDTPLKALLQTVKKNRWSMPATIELEYDVPEGSDAVKEVEEVPRLL